jgi:hypothetical protein
VVGGRVDGMFKIVSNSSYCVCASSRDLGCTPGPLESIIARFTIAFASGSARSYATWWNIECEPAEYPARVMLDALPPK